MLPRHPPDRIRIRIAFDDHRLVANAGLILPSTLALRLGLPQLVDRRLDLGHVTGRANTGDKMMTLVASALAGGDCINDADALRAHAFTVTGGSVTGARRLEPPSNIGWEVVVKPDSNGDVTITLPATTDCNAQGAICTGDGRPLSNRLEITVSGPGG